MITLLAKTIFAAALIVAVLEGAAAARHGLAAIQRHQVQQSALVQCATDPSCNDL